MYLQTSAVTETKPFSALACTLTRTPPRNASSAPCPFIWLDVLHVPVVQTVPLASAGLRRRGSGCSRAIVTSVTATGSHSCHRGATAGSCPSHSPSPACPLGGRGVPGATLRTGCTPPPSVTLKVRTSAPRRCPSYTLRFIYSADTLTKSDTHFFENVGSGCP